jgi:hypothetical protein
VSKKRERGRERERERERENKTHWKQQKERNVEGVEGEKSVNRGKTK